MRAVELHGKGDIRFADTSEPALASAHDVLLAIEAAGICGSDIHNFRTGQWISRTPSIPGHEFCATVKAIGPAVESLAVGDRVVADSRYWCGACAACASGDTHLCARLGFVGEVCDGGFAEQAVLPARLLLKIDASVPPEIAAAAEPLAVALHAVRRLSPRSGETVLITGCGMIGALSALVLARQGHAVLVADRNPARAALVSATTGAVVVDLESADLSGVAAVVEATGSTAVLKQLIGRVKAGGKIALVGIFHSVLELNPTLLVERELALIGCHAYRDELPRSVAMLKDYADGIAAFLGVPIRLEDVPLAYRRIIAGEMAAPKTIIRP